VGKDRGCGESFLEAIERGPTNFGEVPRGILLCEMITDKSMVKVGKAKEGLNVLYYMRFRPVSDGLNLILGHC
ncbi:hypothetical protein PISMIDRAFT_106759, partial [Pisolithus microcarpus 441]